MPSVEREPQRHDAQPRHAYVANGGNIAEPTHHGGRGEPEEHAREAKHHHVDARSHPHGLFGPVGIFRAECLPNHGGRRSAYAVGRHEGEEQNANGNGVPRHRVGAEGGDEPNQCNPAHRAERHLHGSPTGHGGDVHHGGRFHAHVLAVHMQVACSRVQMPQCPRKAGGSTNGRGPRGAFYTELRERAHTEDEQRVEHDVDGVPQDQHAHGHGGITGTAKRRIDEKEQKHGTVARE
jgi:hypothetical protein